MSKSDLNCSFCGKKKDQTKLLIAGIDAHICDLCIEQANGIIIQENKSQQKLEDKSDLQILKPQQIKLFLDDYIIGQDFTKKVISVSVLSLIHISEPTRRTPISYAVFCLKKKK